MQHQIPLNPIQSVILEHLETDSALSVKVQQISDILIEDLDNYDELATLVLQADQRIKALKNAAKTAELHKNIMRQAMIKAMSAQDIRVMQSQQFAFRVSRGREVARLIDESINLDQIPTRFIKQTIDKDALKKAIKAGDTDAQKIATIERGDDYVTVKMSE